MVGVAILGASESGAAGGAGAERRYVMSEKSFLGALFDFSFTQFITTRVIPVIYGLAIFFSGLIALTIVVSAFRMHASLGVLVLLVSPLLFLLYVAAARVSLELVIIVFRIHENIGRMAVSGPEGTHGPHGGVTPANPQEG
jgi:hypothetical protein